MPLPPDRKLQIIATDHIGAFMALALEQPSAFIGEVMEIAANELTMDGIGEVLSRVIGREVHFSEMPIDTSPGPLTRGLLQRRPNAFLEYPTTDCSAR